MANLLKIITVAGAIGVIIYFLYFYTVPFDETEIFIQSRDMLSEEHNGEVNFTNEGRYGEYMLHIKMKPKGKKERDYYCGYTEINILCSSSVEGLNNMAAESHSNLKRISMNQPPG